MAWYETMFATEDPARLNYSESETSRNQVDFIIDKMPLEPGARVLDLCCGQGRHLIDLARRGYDVVWLDLSAYMLGECEKAAAAEGIQPTLIHADMREIPFTADFDAVINMYTSFGYLESDDEDQKVLKAASLALKGGGRLLIDTINRDALMADFRKQSWRENSRGDIVLSEADFDSITGRLNCKETTIHGTDGRKTDNHHSIRIYTYNEIDKMLQKAGLVINSVYGGFDSSPFNFHSRRMTIIACKPG